MSVEEALNKRRSVRDYVAGSLTLEQVAHLLWAASGSNLYRRTAPSAGATYPLEFYLVAGEVAGLEQGTYHYVSSTHTINLVRAEDIRRRLSRASLGQTVIEKAPASIVIAADYERTCGRYGQRGTRYVHMEAGHAGQNISLEAVALNLGTVMVGAFDDKSVKEILVIEEEPLYIIPTGKV